MPSIKVIRNTLLFVLALTLSTGCSSSRKVKKKCRECPKFSLAHENYPTSCIAYEEL